MYKFEELLDKVLQKKKEGDTAWLKAFNQRLEKCEASTDMLIVRLLKALEDTDALLKKYGALN